MQRGHNFPGEKKFSKSNLSFFAGVHLTLCASDKWWYDMLMLFGLNGKRVAPQEKQSGRRT